MTLVEAVVAVLIVGVMLAASIATVGASRKALGAGSDRTQGLELASELMDEIMAQPYDDPNGVAAIPSTGDRSQFNNLGDYAGWTETPPADKAGTPRPGFTGWTRQVAIRYLLPGNVGSASATDQGVSQVTVRVLRGSTEAARLTGLRTRGLPATQACMFGDGTCANLTAADCAARGGTAQGAGTSCWTLPVPEPPNPGVGLVSHWAMDDASGTQAVDSIGSNDATLLNGPTWGTGRFNGALVLDGGNDYATASHDASLSLESTFTLAAWINLAQLPGATAYVTVMHKGTTTTTRNYFLQVYGSLLTFGFYDASNTLRRFSFGSISTVNRWYHVAATFDDSADAVQLYIDGALVRGFSTTYVPKANTGALTLGRSPYGDYLKGRLDGVRIYSRVLSPAEITTLYNGGEP